MSYQSLGFIAFSAAVVFCYYLFGRKAQKVVLALANLAFYAMAGIQYLPFLLVTLLATYFTGRRMGSIYQKADENIAICETPAAKKRLRERAKKRAKRALIIGILVTVALLVVCKYTTFILTNVNAALASFGVATLPMFKVVLPIGISFYSFMALSYILDVYWKRYKAEKNFLTYAVYLTYFPHVVQGPIDRFNEFKEQIAGGVKFQYKNLTDGALLSLWGFFKKLVIADRLGLFVDTVFEKYATADGSILVVAVLVFSIQIYADFSGCIDIVTGVSQTLGIHLRKNFNHPYFSKTMAEFWRRWHISLQEWFKDYIYFPVSASALVKKVKKRYTAKGKLRAAELFSTCVPIAVVWLITGIWHGAAWKYVVWGLFHAFLLIGSRLLEPVFKGTNKLLGIKTDAVDWKAWQICRTFLLCGIGRVFFRAADMTVAKQMFVRMFTAFSVNTLPQTILTYGLDGKDWIVALAAIVVLFIVDLLQERMSIREALSRQHLPFRWVLIFGALFAVIIFGMYGPGYDASSFIYEQF